MEYPTCKLAIQKSQLMSAAIACTELTSFERSQALNLIYEAIADRKRPLRLKVFNSLLLQVMEAGKNRVDTRDFTPVIVNLTQHPASKELRDVGVVDLDGGELYRLTQALTFEDIPSCKDIERAADLIASLAVGKGNIALIGGAPHLMNELESALQFCGIRPVYSFSERVSVEKDGVE